MGFLQIKSTNNNLSHILQKNPASRLQLKKHKKGMLFFMFSDPLNPTDFNIYFQDSSSEVSYLENENSSFEYINTSRYNNARMYLDMFQEVLFSARRDDNEFDINDNTHTVFLNLLETQFKTIDIFKRYFEPLGIKIDYIEKSIDNWQILITYTGKLKYLLNVSSLFLIFAALNSKDFVYIGEEMIDKYIKIANYLDVPYFIKYLIKIRMVRSFNKFKKIKPDLELSNNFKFEFEYGDTHDMRINFVKQYISGNNPILDIGTGIDARYMRFLGPATYKNDKKYYAIDIDEEARFKIKRRIENNGLSNVSLYENINEALIDYEFDNKPLIDVLCTEVLEHNELDYAKILVMKILNEININSLLITVPNFDFNQFYSIERFRHEDHKWEISFENFKKFINNCMIGLNDKYEVNFYQIGDKVNNISVSSGCVIKTHKVI